MDARRAHLFNSIAAHSIETRWAQRTSARNNPSATGDPRHANRNWTVLCCLSGLLLLILAGCGGPLKDASAPAPSALPLTFAPSISYATALQEITDVGLQPAVYCGTEADRAAGRLVTDLRWQPAGQQATFAKTHRLFVVDTALRAPDSVINALPGVVHVGVDINYCQSATYYYASATQIAELDVPTPPPGAVWVMTAPQVNQAPWARAAFTSTTDYATALYEISNLGLGLADVCYEQEEARIGPQYSPPWHPMGQESNFAATHTLVLGTGPLVTPVNWEDQLRALPGVTSVEVPYTTSCSTNG